MLVLLIPDDPLARTWVGWCLPWVVVVSIFSKTMSFLGAVVTDFTTYVGEHGLGEPNNLPSILLAAAAAI